MSECQNVEMFKSEKVECYIDILAHSSIVRTLSL